MRNVEIDGRPIGPGQPPYLIAEISGNHNGDFDRATALIEAAHDAGADAVKLQTYTADTMTLDLETEDFQIREGLWAGRSLHALYRAAHTPWEWHAPLFARARARGLTAFSSAFDETAVDFLEGLGVPAYKIASFEAVDLPLIRRVAATGKPIIISTGMADAQEIEAALAAARVGGDAGGAGAVALLHCVSGYPTPAEDSNLRTLADMAARFEVPIGLSDHTLGTSVAVAAVALGAAIVEKHLTLRRDDDGPDAAFSLEPEEFAQLAGDARAAWRALGQVTYERKASEQPNLRFRRSLYAVADIGAGEILTTDNIRSIRPGFGLAPKHLPALLGSTASRPIARGTPLDWSMIDGRPHGDSPAEPIVNRTHT